MKKAALALIIFSALCGLPLPEAHANELSTLIIELESSINESGHSSAWAGRRNAWLASVRSCMNVGCYKALLIEFEADIKPDVRNSSWRGQRAEWLRTVQEAVSVRTLAQALIDVEMSINYSAQTSSWRNRRSGWLNRARNIR